MKKLGTPSGAAPGSANEKVGFEVVGTPGPVMPLDCGVTGAFCLAVVVVLVAVVPMPLMSLPVVLPELEKLPEPPLLVVVVEPPDPEEEPD
jgi:hypothetical protein